MIAVALAAALALPPQGSPRAAKTDCKPDQPIETRFDQQVTPRKLGDMPPGVLMHAVLITVGHCAVAEERGPAGFGKANWEWRTLGDTQSQDVGPRSVTPLTGNR